MKGDADFEKNYDDITTKWVGEEQLFQLVHL